MRLWRISNYADLTGEGGRRVAGRWHRKGTPTVYLAENPALALLEVMVHLEIDPSDLPSNYQLLLVEVPDSMTMEEIVISDLDAKDPNWRLDSTVSREATESWFVENRTALLRVPSVILPHSSNYLLNPNHPQAVSAKIVSAEYVQYDKRLFVAD